MTNFCLKTGTVLRSSKRNYTVKKVLGYGGFGITYLVEGVINDENISFTTQYAVKEHFIKTMCTRDPKTQRVVALQPATDEVNRSLRAFVSEAQRHKNLDISHPNIVKVNEVFEANGTAYFVMEYLNGGSLAEFVKQRGRLSWDEVVALCKPIVDAVALLHKSQVAHYDIKPQNIMLVQNGNTLRPVLIDFGLAKHYDIQGNITSTLISAGYTPGYAPVEQFGGFPTFQPTADVYALGATMLYCLTGHTPVRAQDLKITDVRNELNGIGISSNIVNALVRALEYHSDNRPANAGALSATLFGKHPIPPDSNPNTPKEPTTQKETQQQAAKPTQPEVRTAEQLYIQGEAFYNTKKYRAAFDRFLKAAEQGHPKAQYRLGECYYYGRGVTKNYTTAVEWFTKAAKQGDTQAQYLLRELYTKASEKGDAQAQYRLGDCYEHGLLGVPKNYTMAVVWYTKAAEKGDAQAQYRLGDCYEHGLLGVTKNYTTAVEWFTKAAKQGDTQAQYQLGECYFYGRGVTKDYAKAVEWYTKAVEQGHNGAKKSILRAKIYKWLSNNSERISTSIWIIAILCVPICVPIIAYINPSINTMYERGASCYNDEEYEEAVDWYRKAAEQGHAGAQNDLGNCYYNGQGVTQSYSEAVDWYRKAAEQGHAQAQNNLGNCYYNGWGVTQSYSEAIGWYSKSKDQGNMYGQFNFGWCYYNGNGVTQSYPDAVYWFYNAAKQGHANAQVLLGICYINGWGVQRNYTEAISWFVKAEEQGSSSAQNQLGVCYEYGFGVEQSYSEAVKWYRKAAERCNSVSQYKLGDCYEYGKGVPQSKSEALTWYRKAAEQGCNDAKEAVQRLESQGYK